MQPSTDSQAYPLSLNATPSGLAVQWPHDETIVYPWFWLRDHGHDPDTLHPLTQQRQLFTAGLPSDVAGEQATLDNDTVIVRWQGGGESRFPVDFLARWRDTGYPADPEPSRVLWDADIIQREDPQVDYTAVMNTDAGLRDWLEQVIIYGFCRVTGVPTTPEATRELAERVGYLRQTIFGDFWDFTADLSKADTAYTNLELRPHTDSTYSHDAPGLQMFHCLAFEGSGGESVLVDGFRIAWELERNHPEAFALLSRVRVPGQYIGDGAWLRAERPVFRHDTEGKLVQVTFNNYDRAPFRLPDAEMNAFYEALRAFETLANDHRYQWRYGLRPGEVLLFDNWRAMHGRASYEGKRRLAGCYLNREDLESRLRVLGRV